MLRAVNLEEAEREAEAEEGVGFDPFDVIPPKSRELQGILSPEVNWVDPGSLFIPDLENGDLATFDQEFSLHTDPSLGCTDPSLDCTDSSSINTSDDPSLDCIIGTAMSVDSTEVEYFLTNMMKQCLAVKAPLEVAQG